MSKITQGITIKMRNLHAILKEYFREKPSLEDYIAAHNPTDQVQLEYLEKQYSRFMVSKNFWGTAF